MYALHFYAGTHKEWNQEKLKTAHKKGLPVMVTEFSICDASGNGALDKAPAINGCVCWTGTISAILRGVCVIRTNLLH